MAYEGTYTAFWNHQTQLFREIEILKYQMTITGSHLHRAQETLTKEGLKRNARRKANWTVTLNRRHLNDLERELQALTQALVLCQAQLARMHTEAFQRTSFTPYVPGMRGYGHPQIWDPPYTPAATAISRPLNADSGYSEPALYAQPFDLDLSQDSGSHLFSHELPTPLPAAETHTASPTLNPTVAEFTPGAVSQSQCASPRGARSVDSVPVSPMTKTSASLTKRRYSEAAISLIESRLRQKRVQEGGTTGEGDEAGDVNTGVAAGSARRGRARSAVLEQQQPEHRTLAESRES